MVLKKLKVTDLALLNIWLNKDYVRKYLGEPSEWINEIKENMDKSDWIKYFIVFSDNIPIGFVQYYETNKAPEGIWSKEPEGTIGIDYLIGEEDYLQKGYGTIMIRNLIYLIRKTNKYKFIVADPVIENMASVSVLIDSGFIKQRSGLYKLVLR